MESKKKKKLLLLISEWVVVYRIRCNKWSLDP